jgi:gas vesicle protein
VGRAERKAAKRAKKAAKRRRRGGFLFGAVAGAVAGLLLAPRSGKETRSQLLGGEGGFGGQVDRIMGAVGAGKESAADQSEALKRKIEETRERLRQQTGADEQPPAGDAPAE